MRTVILLAVASSLLACGAPRKEIVIGLIAMLHGENADNGRNMTNAATLAVKEVNARGGLRIGREKMRVTLLVEDDPNTPEGALDAARKLLSQDRLVAIVGPQFSGNAIPVARLAESSRIVMIAPMSTNPETTAGKRYVFRVPFLDTFQGFVIARFARDELKAARAAVLYDVATEYNRRLADEFRKVFAERGGSIVSFEAYTTDRKEDLSAQLTRIALARPDVLFLPNYATDVTLQAQQARRKGITAVFLGGDGWDPVFAQDDLFDGSFITRQWHPTLSRESSRGFIASYTAAYQEVPEDVAATTYDAFGLLFAGMEGAASVEPGEIQRELHEMRGFEGITGRLEYPTGGDPRKNAVVLRFKDRKASVYAIVEP